MRECHPEAFFHRFTVLGLAWGGKSGRNNVCAESELGEEAGRERRKEESEWYIKDSHYCHNFI